jgi:hypothetical protein
VGLGGRRTGSGCRCGFGSALPGCSGCWRVRRAKSLDLERFGCGIDLYKSSVKTGMRLILTETYIRAVKWVGEQNEVSRPGRLVRHVLSNLLRALVVLLNANYRQRGRKDGGCRRVGNSGEVGELMGEGLFGCKNTYNTVKLA